MNKNALSPRDYQIFLLKSLLWLGLGWGAFISALAGYFHITAIWLIFAIAAILLIRQTIRHRVMLRPSRELWTATIVLFFFVAAFSIFTTPTVFSGRDQGSLSEAAIRLAQNHKLEFSTPASTSFFKLHEPGRAQNFPGFYYTSDGSLTTQFPLVYTSWLALFYATFGITGFYIANALLLHMFFLSFYLLARLFLNWGWAASTLLLTLTSFSMTWFGKFTLSENMALPLVWLTILSLMLFLNQQRKLHYFILLTSSLLLFFTRIEGMAFLVVLVAIIACHKDVREYIKSNTTTRLLFPSAVLLVLFIANAFRDFYFYKEIAKAVLPAITLPQAKYLGELKNAALPNFYFIKVFGIYGMLGFFILGGASIIIHALRKDIYKLIPLFFIAPTLIYFFDSHITPDHPWMLRRFIFSLLPAAIFYSGLLLGRWHKYLYSINKGFLSKSIPILIAAALILFNIPSFTKYITFSENKGLLSQTENLGNNFSKNDLILVDREASGDGWNMLTGPMSFLYGKNAVYFFNNQDLSRLDLGQFEKVYLIAPDEKAPFYKNSTIGGKLTEVEKYSLITVRLDVVEQGNPLSKLRLPEKKKSVTNGIIFQVENQQ